MGYSHIPPREVRDEESSVRADPGKEGEGQAAHAAACAARQRQCQSDLSVLRGIAAAQAKKFDIVLIDDSSRLSRKLSDTLNLA